MEKFNTFAIRGGGLVCHEAFFQIKSFYINKKHLELFPNCQYVFFS